MSVDPILCAADVSTLAVGTGRLFVDDRDVGNVAIIDPAGEGENVTSFRPHSEAEDDISQAQVGFQSRIIIEATCDAITIENLELLLKEEATAFSGGWTVPLTTVRDETLHTVVFEHDLELCGGEECTMLAITLRRASIELPWALPFRRDAFSEYVLRFVALPDAAFPASPFGYVTMICPGVVTS